jgi:hypothetical protein
MKRKRQTDRHTDIQTDIQTDRQTGIQTGIQREIQRDMGMRPKSKSLAAVPLRAKKRAAKQIAPKHFET